MPTIRDRAAVTLRQGRERFGFERLPRGLQIATALGALAASAAAVTAGVVIAAELALPSDKSAAGANAPAGITGQDLVRLDQLAAQVRAAEYRRAEQQAAARAEQQKLNGEVDALGAMAVGHMLNDAGRIVGLHSADATSVTADVTRFDAMFLAARPKVGEVSVTLDQGDSLLTVTSDTDEARGHGLNDDALQVTYHLPLTADRELSGHPLSVGSISAALATAGTKLVSIGILPTGPTLPYPAITQASSGYSQVTVSDENLANITAQAPLTEQNVTTMRGAVTTTLGALDSILNSVPYP